ncbi:hypothetical protein K7432_009456 [Basidiobolus ranarum]|uniref:Carrier domain-containing protein n=1 Tax=Basidiobolus ranarum TaxID=34480 RepID=A0ABR2WQ72_9FUNG
MISPNTGICQFPHLLTGEFEENTNTIDFHTSKLKILDLSHVYHHAALKGVAGIERSLLYAAWVIMLNLYTGSPDITFGIGLPTQQHSKLMLKDLQIFQSTYDHEIEKLHVSSWLKNLAFNQKVNHQDTAESSVQDASGFNTCVIFSDQERSIDLHQLKFAICLQGYISEDGIDVRMTFANSHLSQNRGVLFTEQFIYVAKTLLSNLDAPLDSLNWTPENEKSLFLTEWQQGKLEYVQELDDSCIHHFIEEQVKSTPDNIALQFEDKESVTYAEMNKRANILAHSLIQLGVQPDDLVPLCIEKSTNMVVAILAVLKAGAAYVPLDPEYPKERIDFILGDTKARVCITTSSLKGMFAEWQTIQLLIVDGSDYCCSESNPVISGLKSSNLCYLIFTSGSTGKPKGVMLEHRSVVNYVTAHKKILNLAQNDRFLQFANYTFDASILDLFVNLITGSCICLASKNNLLTNLAGMMCLMEVTAAQLTTTVASLLDPNSVPTLKLLQQGGEMLTKFVRDAWASKVKLHNGYGPTETAVYTIIKESVQQSTSCTNIGWPIGRSKVLILNDRLELVPLGAVGELCIGGPQLARGYLNRPDLTEKSFVSSLYTHGERLYRSGDLGRFNPDGSITILGRKDNQVKLNGLRIEIEEIEHILSLSPEVNRVSVKLLNRKSKTSKRSKVLVAFLTIKNKTSEKEPVSVLEMGNRSEINRIQESVRKQLPPYMVPTVWIPLTRMPINTSGKTDLKTLKLLYMNNDFIQDAKETKDTPISPMEKLLQEVWGDVLNVEKSSIGTGDSFYHLGGDSISAIQISAQCRHKGIEISVQSILQHPTIRQLVNYAQFTTLALEKQSIEEGQDEGADIPFTPIQHQFFGVTQSDVHHFHLSWLVSVKHPIEIAALERALSELTSHHDMLRTRFTYEQGRWRQWLASNEEVNFEVQHYQVSGIEQLQSSILQVQRSLNIETGPVSSFIIYDLPSGEQLLFMTIHHYIIDLVSWRIIWEDLEKLLNGQTLSDKTLSFRKWSRLLQKHAESLTVKSWPQQAPIEPLDIDVFKLPLNTMETVNTLSFTLNSEYTTLLFGRSNDAYGTEAVDFMLSTLATSYCDTFNAHSITFATEGHGREPWDDSIDISRTIGWFTSIYPVTIVSNQGDSIMDILKQTKDTRRTIPNRGLDYGLLRYLNEELSSRFGNDSFQVGFNYFGRFQHLEKGGSLFQQIDDRYAFDLNMIGPKWRRMNAIEVEVTMQRDNLCASISYSSELHREGQINKWLQSWKRDLMEAIHNSANKEKRAMTVSDIPLLNLNAHQLNEFMEEIGAKYGDEFVLNIEDIYPCSVMQEGLIAGNARSASSYHVQDVYTLPDGVDSEQLISAWRATINDLSILRTVFINDLLSSTSGTYLQVVLRHFHIDFNHIFTETKDVDIVLNQYLEEDVAQGFPLGKPNIRLCLLHGEKDKMIISRHHAINDGWSDKITIAYLEAVYNNTPRPAVVPYKDYISYCIKESESFNNTAGEEYWSTYLAGVDSCVFPKLGDMNAKIEHHQIFSRSRISTQMVKEFSKKTGVTLLTILQASWGLILQPYYGKDDFVYGVLTNGRNISMKYINQVVGPCINTTPLRIQYDADTTVMGWLQSLHQSMVTRIPYENCGLRQIRQWCRHNDGQVNFDAILNFQLSEKEDAKQMVTFQLDRIVEPTEYRLCLNAWIEDDEFAFRLDFYNATLTDELAGSLLDRLDTTIASIVGVDDASPIAHIPHISNVESSIIRSFSTSSNQVDITVECLHHLFEKQAADTPNNIAIQYESNYHLTYDDLNKQSNQLAHYLMTQGVRPESMVLLYLEKSVEMIVAMLAVLKAGGAYVPIDPNSPVERSKFVQKETGASIVITTCSHKVLPEHRRE